MRNPRTSARTVLLRLLGVGVAIVFGQFAFAQSTPVGGIVSDFALVNRATGAALKLSDYSGKIIMLDFFAYWCRPCLTSSSDVDKNIQKYYAARGGNSSGLPVQVISINIEQANKKATDAFIRDAGLALVGDDVDGNAVKMFDAGALPVFVIINGVENPGTSGVLQWQIVSRHSGYPGAEAMRKVIDAIKPPKTARAAEIPSGRSSFSALRGPAIDAC